MNKDLLVEIFVPVTDGPGVGRIGTGYPVANERILTARHVLFPPHRDNDKPIEIRWHYQPGAQRAWKPIAPVQVLWPGDDDCDAAVIACPFPPNAERWGVLAVESPHPADWESEGFPAVGQRDDGARVATALRGRLHRMAKAASFFALDLDVGPNRDELLKGASGSPVMSQWMLYGVIVDCPRHFDAKRLWAVPSCRLLERPGFCQAIGRTARTAVLDLLKEQVILDLTQSTDALAALETALPLPDAGLAGRRPDDWAARLVKRLFDLKLDEVIPTLRKAHRELCLKRKTGAAQRLAQAANAIVPAVFDRALVHPLQSRLFDGAVALVELPAATRTVAEILMAGAEGRPTCFSKAEEGNTPPVATYGVKQPPTEGLDADGRRWTDDLERALAEKYAIYAEDDRRLNEAQRRRLIADWLEFEVDEQRTRYLAFQFTAEDDWQKARAALLALKQRYRALDPPRDLPLALLDLSNDGSQIVEERRLFRPFEEIIKTALEPDA